MRRNREVDMSPDAIDRRLRDLAGLYRLGISLKEAVYIGPVEEDQSTEAAKPVSDIALKTMDASRPIPGG